MRWVHPVEVFDFKLLLVVLNFLDLIVFDIAWLAVLISIQRTVSESDALFVFNQPSSNNT
jgi:hypothetical protein